MSTFRRRILGLAAMATAFVGVSFGQALTCTDTVANATGGITQPQINSALRSEGQTEQLSLLQFACTASTAVGTPVGSTTATVTITTNLAITSKAIAGLAGGANSEATLVVGGNPAGAGGVVTVGAGVAYQGAVSGNSVTFQGVTIPTSALLAGGGGGTTTYFQVANIRVNASSATTIPYQSSESGLIAYTTSTTSGVTTAYTSVPATLASGLVVTSLGAPKITGPLGIGTLPVGYTICAGNATGLSFILNINQIISGAFLGLGQPPVGEAGQYAPGGGSGIGVANADIINVTLGGLPVGGTVYVPQTIAVGTFPVAPAIGNNTTLSIAGSTALTAPPALLASIPFPVPYAVSAAGTVTIPYTVSGVSGLGAAANSNFPVGVVVAFAGNSITTATQVTGTYFYAPTAPTLTGPATTVPTFLGTLPTANGVSIVLCQTTLLFPFVTNQLGFDTGIVLANTSADNLKGANPIATPAVVGTSAVSSQPGYCTLNFYGAGAPSGPVTAPPGTALNTPYSQPAGTTNAFQLSSVAPGFQGYVISVCTYLYGHGYAFIEYNLTQGNGVAEGYLALVIGDRGQAPAETLTN